MDILPPSTAKWILPPCCWEDSHSAATPNVLPVHVKFNFPGVLLDTFSWEKKMEKTNLCWLDNVKFHCSRLKFQFFLRKKKHVWYISWVGPPPFSVKIKGSPQAQQPHPRVQPPSLPAAAATWEWWVTKGRWGWNSTQLMWIHWVNGHFRESGGTYHKDP